jgi:hypothetical protein
MATARSTSDDAPSSPALPPACAPYVGRPLDASGRGGDGALAGYGDDLITTARATGRRKPALRRAPRRGGARRQLELGAVLARAEDGHSFLRALTPRALSAAINEGDLAPRAARRDAGHHDPRRQKFGTRARASAGGPPGPGEAASSPPASMCPSGSRAAMATRSSHRIARAGGELGRPRPRRGGGAQPSPDERHHRPRKIP